MFQLSFVCGAKDNFAPHTRLLHRFTLSNKRFPALHTVSLFEVKVLDNGGSGNCPGGSDVSCNGMLTCLFHQLRRSVPLVTELFSIVAGTQTVANWSRTWTASHLCHSEKPTDAILEESKDFGVNRRVY